MFKGGKVLQSPPRRARDETRSSLDNERKRGKGAERRVAQEESKAREKRYAEAKIGRRRESHAGRNGREDVSIADAGEEARTKILNAPLPPDPPPGYRF